MAVRPLCLAPQMMAAIPTPQIGYVGASQTFKEGSPLILSTQQLVIAVTAPVSGSPVLVGMAAADAPTVQGTAFPFYPFMASLVLEATLAGAASAATVLAAATHFMLPVGLTLVTATGFWYADTSAATCATVVGFRDPVGTTDARVYILLDYDVTVFAS
jgi:hypothetical protein